VILFYFFGDVITTLYALRLGYKEGNRIVVRILRHFGPVGFTITKLLPVCCLFYYFTLTGLNVKTWEIAITLATVVGFFATVNNLSVVMKLNEKKENAKMLKSGLKVIETLISK
jgi:predicted MFS family arabinose efflux permease